MVSQNDSNMENVDKTGYQHTLQELCNLDGGKNFDNFFLVFAQLGFGDSKIF